MDRPLARVLGFGAVLAATLVGAVAAAGAEGDDLPMPEIVVYLHDAGGDAVDYYDAGAGVDPIELTRQIAFAFGDVPDEPSVTDYRDAIDEVRTAAAQFDGRLPRRRGDTLHLDFDTRRLTRVMAGAGYRDYLLTLCLPDVALDLETTGVDGGGGGGGDCPQWAIGIGDPPIEVSVTLRPDASSYPNVVGGIVALTALGVALAVVANAILRRTLLRSFGPAALVVGAVGVVGSIGPSFVAALLLTILHRPVSSFVIANELAVAQQISATLLPAMLLTVPGAVLAVLALRIPVEAPDAQA